MKKNTQFHIKISSEKKEELKAKAESLGLDLSSFVRLVLNNSLKGELSIK